MRTTELLRIPEFKERFPKAYRAFLLAVPFILGILLILGLRVIYDYNRFLQIAGLVLLYFIPPAGKETIIPAAIALGFPWQVICFSITYIDIISCLFMLWNFDLICRIPVIGGWILYLVQNGTDYLSRHPWIERFCFIGLATFVFLPLQGSGSVGGSILGRILGMSPIRIFLAVTAGATLHSTIIGLSMYAIQEYLDLNLWFIVLFFLFIVLATSMVSLVYYLMKKKGKREKTGNP
ncbi:MAG: small multi-drug export protein [Methanospirillum sp.]|nr:small multi-drug export protein [Methanospirillum sp.]